MSTAEIRIRPALAALTAAAALAAAGARAEPLSVRTAQLEIRGDTASTFFEIRRADGRVFVPRATPGFTNGAARVGTVRHPVLGEGRSIEIAGADGRCARVMLFEGVPFALVQPLFRNGGAATNNIREAAALDASLDAGAPAAGLKALGTAGLTAVDGHAGSYVFLAVASPETRAGVVGAWLTHDRGSGIVFSGAAGDRPVLAARTDYGRLLLAPGAEAEGEIFAIGAFADVRDGLEQWADLVARNYGIRLPPQPDGYCTWYSSPNGGASDEEHIVELSEFAARELAPFGFDFVQIDDKWQDGVSKNGPNRIFERARPSGPYAGGMKPVADRIGRLGLTPGLWFMPFAGTKDDPYFADKQAWFAHNADGTPYETRWGGTTLDMTHPAAREYLAGLVRRIAKDWGYTYFKMDGLWVGTAAKLLYVNNEYKPDDLGEPLVHDPSVTPIEAYRSGLRLVRETAGSNVFLLGCCVSQNMRSFGGAFGRVDAMRIGPDNGSSWEGIRRGPWHHSNRYFLHGRVWYNDPDPVYVRAKMPLEQARAICSWVGLSGALTVASDWLPELPPERIDILKRILPNHGLRPRPVDLLETDLPRLWLLRDDRVSPPRFVLGAFNWDAKEPAHISYDCAKAGLPAGPLAGFDFWANRFLPPFRDRIEIDVPPASCRILALREAGPQPGLVSTSRHVSQGAVDIVSEQWDGAKGELRGVSRLVAGDACELRIVVPLGADSWQAVEEGTSSAAGRIVVKQNGPQVRVTISPVRGGECGWTVRFRRAAVAAPAAQTPAGLQSSFEAGRVRLAWAADESVAYRVVRGGGWTTEVTSAEFADPEAEAGKTNEYAVSGRAWDGTWSAPATVRAIVPAKPAVPPPPPAPEVHLSDLKPVSAKTGWGSVRMDRSCEGKPLVLDGRTHARGVGVHANSELVYAIPAGMKRFVAVVGLDDEKKDDERSSVVFQVFGDVKEMGEAPELLAESPLLKSGGMRVWHLQAALSDRMKEIRLVVRDGDDGIASDHADWADAGFLKTPPAQP